MKTKHLKSVLWMAAIITIVLLLTWWRKKQPTTNDREVVSPIADNTTYAETNPPASESQNDARPSGLPAATNGAPEYSKETRLGMAENLNEAVNFYARLVDQDEHGVHGVKIRMTIRRWTPSTNESVGVFPVTGEFEGCDLVSDANGCFQITGKRGDNLELKSIEKDDHELSPRQQRSFSPSSGNSENPTIIRMWKKGLAEPLIMNGKFFRTKSDGRTNLIDLVTGKKTENAQLDDKSISIRIECPPNASNSDKFDWNVNIQMTGGGLLESSDEFMYRAPESGYDPNIAIQFTKDAPGWSPQIKRRYFIKTANGWHGHIDLEIYPIYDREAAFELKSVINPSGSRNLEYDPAVQPKPKVYE